MGRLGAYEAFYKAQVDVMLKAMLGSDELVAKWWDSPNKAFDNKTPKEVFDIRPDDVTVYVLNFIQR